LSARDDVNWEELRTPTWDRSYLGEEIRACVDRQNNRYATWSSIGPAGYMFFSVFTAITIGMVIGGGPLYMFANLPELVAISAALSVASLFIGAFAETRKANIAAGVDQLKKDYFMAMAKNTENKQRRDGLQKSIEESEEIIKKLHEYRHAIANRVVEMLRKEGVLKMLPYQKNHLYGTQDSYLSTRIRVAVGVAIREARNGSLKLSKGSDDYEEDFVTQNPAEGIGIMTKSKMKNDS